MTKYTIKDFAEYHDLSISKVYSDLNRGSCPLRGTAHNEARKRSLLLSKGYHLELPKDAVEHPTLPVAACPEGTIWQYDVVMGIPIWKKRSPAYKKTNPISKTKYGTLGLVIDGQPTYFYVHRIVAECYLGKRNDLVINHIDGNGTNNHIENLEWVTQQENMHHANTVLMRGRPQRKVVAYNTVTKTHEIYDNSRQAAEVLGVHYQTVRNSANNGIITKSGYKFKWIAP